jgi:hypothetical protein
MSITPSSTTTIRPSSVRDLRFEYLDDAGGERPRKIGDVGGEYFSFVDRDSGDEVDEPDGVEEPKGDGIGIGGMVAFVVWFLVGVFVLEMFEVEMRR